MGPVPNSCPLLRSFVLVAPAPLPRPFLRPALLTLVTDFHRSLAETESDEIRHEIHRSMEKNLLTSHKERCAPS